MLVAYARPFRFRYFDGVGARFFSKARTSVWIIAAWLHGDHASAAERLNAASDMVVLTDEQLDAVTAEGGRVALELFATASGPAATSFTSGSLMTARSIILRVAVDHQAPETAQTRLIGISPVDYIFAAGNANSSGDGNALCSADFVGEIDLVFKLELALARLTPTAATCSCAAFAIAPVMQIPPITLGR